MDLPYILTGACRHFHATKDLEGVAAGLDLDVCLMVDKNVIDSALDGKNSLGPYIVAVDVTEFAATEEYFGCFKVDLKSLVEFYVKLGMGLKPVELWATMEQSNDAWGGDE